MASSSTTTQMLRYYDNHLLKEPKRRDSRDSTTPANPGRVLQQLFVAIA